MPNRPKRPKKPQPAQQPTGLYEGEAGAHAAKEDPLAFFNHVLSLGGRTAHNTAPDYWDWLQNQGFSGFYSQYQNALADPAQGGERLTWLDFLGNFGQANPFAGQSAITPADGRRRRRRR